VKACSRSIRSRIFTSCFGAREGEAPTRFSGAGRRLSDGRRLYGQDSGRRAGVAQPLISERSCFLSPGRYPARQSLHSVSDAAGGDESSPCCTETSNPRARQRLSRQRQVVAYPGGRRESLNIEVSAASTRTARRGGGSRPSDRAAADDARRLTELTPKRPTNLMSRERSPR